MNIKSLEERYVDFVPSSVGDSNKRKGKEQEKRCVFQERVPVKKTEKDIEECVSFLKSLQKKHAEIQEQIASLYLLGHRIQDIQLGMCNCFPAEYDEDKLLLAYYYVPVFIEKSEYWGFRHVNREESEKYREAFLYAKGIWQQMTSGVDAYNFSIGEMANETEVYFRFTISNIPGKVEIHLPIGKKYGDRQRNDLAHDLPMQIWVYYAMAPLEDVWHTIGRTHHIKDVPVLLKSFVDADKYKDYLPKDTIEHKSYIDGHEIIWEETQEVPLSVWDAIEKSRQESGIEKGPIV